MKKILVALSVAALVTAISVAPALADGWGGSHGRDCGFNPLWPVAAALAIPAAIIGTVAQLTVPAPRQYVYVPQPAPVVYEQPVTYYAPRPYYPPRAYVPPRGYYPPRG